MNEQKKQKAVNIITLIVRVLSVLKSIFSASHKGKTPR